MDINLSSDDLAFRDEVRSFFDENKIKSGEDYFSWRLGWFEKAREKGGWDVPWMDSYTTLHMGARNSSSKYSI